VLPSLLRVKWSPSRVCLEGVELPLAEEQSIAVRSTVVPPPPGAAVAPNPGSDVSGDSWMVARFAGGSSAGRVGVVPAAELRAAYDCRVVVR